MHYLTAVLAALAMVGTSGVSAEQNNASPVLACVAPEKLGCGCQIRVAHQPCANRRFAHQPHMFTELDANAPLLLVIDGQDRSLKHIGHVGSSVKGDPPGRSTDLYESEDLKVKLRYTNAPSTCPKDKLDGCEFTDVKVEVTVSQRDRKAWVRKGYGTCGC